MLAHLVAQRIAAFARLRTLGSRRRRAKPAPRPSPKASSTFDRGNIADVVTGPLWNVKHHAASGAVISDRFDIVVGKNEEEAIGRCRRRDKRVAPAGSDNTYRFVIVIDHRAVDRSAYWTRSA